MQAQQASLRWDLGLLQAVVFRMGPRLLPSGARLTAVLQVAFATPSKVPPDTRSHRPLMALVAHDFVQSWMS